MVTTGAPRMKITYATLSADNEELQAAFDRALDAARAQLGERYPMLIGDERRFADEEFEDRSPIDSSVVETTRSMSMKGTNRKKPIWKPVFSSEITYAGMTTRIGRS